MEDPSEVLHKLVLEDAPCVDKLTECFRSLRNTCASSPDVQSELGQKSSVLTDVNTVISKGLCTSSSDEWTLCLRISAQFLGNLIVYNTRNQEIVWVHFSSQLKEMAQRGDSKLTNICMMILYNILLGCPNLTKDVVNDQEFVNIICESGAEGMEFACFVLEHLLTQDVEWSKLYMADVAVKGRLFILDVVESHAKELPMALVQQLATQFCKMSDCILRTLADRVDSLEPVEVATLLQLLASLSAQSEHLHVLQENRSLFISCAFLLKSIHMAGKEENNCFSTVQKLSEADEEFKSHPAFGFKANLVRILGNLCWKNKHNQDMMRELEVIPVLLDCCNIDARNPFIIQCVVLAVRNLSEGNMENQSVIASMTREGVVQSAVLTELGMTLHSDEGNNQIRIAPLKTTSDR